MQVVQGPAVLGVSKALRASGLRGFCVIISGLGVWGFGGFRG